MLSAGVDKDKPKQDLKVAGIIVMFVAPGLSVLGWFLGQFNDKVFGAMIGISLLVLIIGVGLFVAGKMTERWQRQDQSRRMPVSAGHYAEGPEPRVDTTSVAMDLDRAMATADYVVPQDPLARPDTRGKCPVQGAESAHMARLDMHNAQAVDYCVESNR